MKTSLLHFFIQDQKRKSNSGPGKAKQQQNPSGSRPPGGKSRKLRQIETVVGDPASPRGSSDAASSEDEQLNANKPPLSLKVGNQIENLKQKILLLNF